MPIGTAIQNVYREIEQIGPPAGGSELWHYTGADTVINILASKEIWTSHFRNLNDRAEIEHGSILLRNVLSEFLNNSTGRERNFFELV